MTTQKAIKNTILVVDNSTDTIKLVRSVLETRGYKVLVAGHPDTAIRLFDEHPEIKLILLDIDLEDETSGIDLARRFQEVQAVRNFSMGFLSGKRIDQAFLDAATKIGVETFISKPINLEKFVKKVEDLLGISYDSIDLSKHLECDFPCELINVNILPDLQTIQVTPTSFLLRSSADFLIDTVLNIQCLGLEPHLCDRYFTVKIMKTKLAKKGSPGTKSFIARGLLLETNYQVKLALESLFARPTPPPGFHIDKK